MVNKIIRQRGQGGQGEPVRCGDSSPRLGGSRHVDAQAASRKSRETGEPEGRFPPL